MKKKYVQVFLDFSIGTKPAGRVVFELFTDITPKTAENFRGLCTGEYGNVGMGKKNKKLHYLNTPIHRIVDGMLIQGGDITNGDGTGGASIYGGGSFVDENFQRRHACAGLLSMANRGRNTNTSQFFITLKTCPHLDGKHVVFGQVVEGMEVVKKIGQVQLDMQDRPVLPIMITNCGEVNDLNKHWKFDPFNKDIIDEYREAKWRDYFSSEIEDEEDEEQKPEQDNQEKELQIPDKDIKTEAQSKLDQKHQERLAELKERIAKAKVQNDKAVLQEEKLNTDAKYNQRYKKQIFQTRKDFQEKDLEFKNIDKEKSYLNKICLQKQEYDNDLEEKKGKKEVFGWEVFNDDAIYNAYKKRCSSLAKNQQLYEKQMQDVKKGNGVEYMENEEAVDRLSQNINKQIDGRKQFSRRRIYVEDEAVTYINERNRIFNKKLQRNFGAYAADIKANLERGTAH